MRPSARSQSWQETAGGGDQATGARNDTTSESITWYPGDNATPANRPVLEIVYQ